jgi:hypothetical protein
MIKKGIFHIHVDATELPGELHTEFRALGLVDTDFCGHPQGYQHFEPNTHMTLKLPDYEAYQQAWTKLVEVATARDGFKGYLEGEHVRPERTFREVPCLLKGASVEPSRFAVPFRIKRRRLRSTETFRASELHLTLDKDASDQRLIRSLLDAGLYGAYAQKADHKALVLTAQSMSRSEIRELLRAVDAYVNFIGGAVRASLKEEVAIDHVLIGVSPEDLPEVIDEVAYPEE